MITTNSGKILFHSTGPISVVFSYLTNAQQVRLQAVNKRTYQVTLLTFMSEVQRLPFKMGKNFFSMGTDLQPDQICQFEENIKIGDLTGNYYGEMKKSPSKKAVPHGVGILARFNHEFLIGNFENGQLVDRIPHVLISN